MPSMPATGTIQMKAMLPNERGTLAPGQFVNVSLVLEHLAQDAVTVPAEAVQQGAEGPFVYVVKRRAPRSCARSARGNAEPGWPSIAEGRRRLAKPWSPTVSCV